jgi:hypothetical protein
MSIRPVKRLIRSKPTVEGAGVRLRRAFGFGNTADTDPFLLLDDFRNDVPADYLAGFPWHPHRGIETITYVLAGTVEHGDSLGNRGAHPAAAECSAYVRAQLGPDWVPFKERTGSATEARIQAALAERLRNERPRCGLVELGPDPDPAGNTTGLPPTSTNGDAQQG